jgi:hypothetical protein
MVAIQNGIFSLDKVLIQDILNNNCVSDYLTVALRLFAQRKGASW